MKKYVIFLLVGMVSLLGCAQPFVPSALTVTLETPANGSTVSSLTPILTWTSGTGDASYRVQVASDGNFQNLRGLLLLLHRQSLVLVPSWLTPPLMMYRGREGLTIP